MKRCRRLRATNRGSPPWRRRTARSTRALARALVDTAQFGAVRTVGLTAAFAITAAASLPKALLRALLNVDSFAVVATSFSGPWEVTDTVAATVLGITGLWWSYPQRWP